MKKERSCNESLWNAIRKHLSFIRLKFRKTARESGGPTKDFMLAGPARIALVHVVHERRVQQYLAAHVLVWSTWRTVEYWDIPGIQQYLLRA